MKNLSIVFFLLAVNPISAQNIVNQLAACYQLNGNADNGSIAGTVLNGTVSNVLTTAGQNNQAASAMYFQGTNSSKIELPQSASFRSNTITISMWFNADSIGATEYLVMAPGNCTAAPYAYAIMLENWGNDVYLIAASQSTTCSKSFALCTNTIVQNKWYFVIASFTPEETLIWFDDCSESGPGAYPNHKTSDKLVLGGNNSIADPAPFKGKMDQVRFYNRLLTPEERDVLKSNSELGCFFVLGIDKNISDNLNQVYPNPTADIINLDKSIISCKIIDLNGRCLLEKSPDSQSTVDLSFLNPGIYFLRTTNERGSTATQKISLIR